MKTVKVGLLAKILLAIVCGILLGNFMPYSIVRFFVTFNALFSELLSFSIPLIIVGLVVVAIADIGRNAGKMLLVTVLLAYVMTLFSGFLAFGTGAFLFPQLIDTDMPIQAAASAVSIPPFFVLKIPPMMDVMTALVTAFLFGLGLAYNEASVLKNLAKEFRLIVVQLIEKLILPLLPLYILGIFINMTAIGEVYNVLITFAKVIGIIFLLHIFLLLFQYTIAGFVVRRNPLQLLKTMLPAYFTALGTQSSAATIPVTLEQVKKNGVSESVAGFVVPLCATIHLSGSILKIVSCALALMIMQGMSYDFSMFAGFIFMLAMTMVAAPGVPGGAIMAALGVLQSILGFDETSQALMIALYIAMDSFGTACNVTGDGALALIIDKIFSKNS